MIKPYYETTNGRLYHGDCLGIMPYLPDVDLTITSPPYGDLRDYKGYVFNFQPTAGRLWDITKDGGVVVWVMGDQTINGSESGESFRQALYFKKIGFNLHDTMIYAKNNPPQSSGRYEPECEYMFIFSKGKPIIFNPIKRNRIWNDKRRQKASHRTKGGNFIKTQKINIESCVLGNIWYYETGGGLITKDKNAFKHPAIFPEALAQDHILSWSNKGDAVLDPMCGSGTVPKMCEKLNRKWLACEISEEYCEISKQRIASEIQQTKMF